MAFVNKPFAEILESSLPLWQGQCWKWDEMPEFGQLVYVQHEQKNIYAIVYTIQTGPKDPLRKPFAYQKSQEQLLEEQPQIFEFLKTDFLCLTVGYEESNHIFYQLPSRPTPIHTFIYPAQAKQYTDFFMSCDYLYLLLQNAHNTVPAQELLLAVLKQLLLHSSFSKEQLFAFIEQYFALSPAQYEDTKLFLRRIQNLLKNMNHPLLYEINPT